VWVWFGGKRKILRHFTAGQVVATSSINDHAARMLFDDTLRLEQYVSLFLFCFLHLCAKHTLHNETLIAICIAVINVFF